MFFHFGSYNQNHTCQSLYIFQRFHCLYRLKNLVDLLIHYYKMIVYSLQLLKNLNKFVGYLLKKIHYLLHLFLIKVHLCKLVFVFDNVIRFQSILNLFNPFCYFFGVLCSHLFISSYIYHRNTSTKY